MINNPNVFLSNFASRRTRGHHGPGRLLSIMVKTPHWSGAEGTVAALIPNAKDLWRLKDNRISIEEYKRRFITSMESRRELLGPHNLILQSEKKLESFEVRDGDTLCCTCSREAAANDRCHRVWVAQALLEHGWDVVLDGKRLF
jgi:hypothetical protein